MWHCRIARMCLLGLLIDLTDKSKVSYRREWMALTNKVSAASLEISRNRLKEWA